MQGGGRMSRINQLIVALDVPDREKARALVETLADHVDIFKVGLELFTAEGPSIMELFEWYEKKVFLDLKFHDIPNTVAGAVAAATTRGVYMLNLHVAGGRQMMERAVEAARERTAIVGGDMPLIIGVTLLTSLTEDALRRDLGIEARVEDLAVAWARLAQDCELDGVVASPREAPAIRRACGGDFIIVTPGVRPAWAAANDQARHLTPAAAIAAGADYLVVGRPITGASDPREAAQRILAEMEEGLGR